MTQTDPYLTATHREFRERVDAFRIEHVEPVAGDLDRRSLFLWENVKRMGELGFLGIPVDPELGGLGLDYLSYILAIETLARSDASHAITVSAHTTLGITPILQFGTDAQRERFVPPLASGRVLGGFGLTEPGAGSDAGGTRTRAVRVEGGYRLTGSKIFITHAGVGEIFTVTAVTDPEARTRGITSFIVCKPTVDLEIANSLGIGHLEDLPFTEGVSAGEKEDKMGWRASDTRELYMEEAFVPDEQRVGEEGQGFVNFMKTLDAGRIGIAALSLGLAQGAYDAALQFALRDSGSEDRVWDRQSPRFSLSELATKIEAARHLTYHAAWRKDRGLPFTREAAMAKLFASEMAMDATRDTLQILGQAGLGSEFPVERIFRDTKVCEIGEGTSEVQKLVIGRQILESL